MDSKKSVAKSETEAMKKKLATELAKDAKEVESKAAVEVKKAASATKKKASTAKKTTAKKTTAAKKTTSSSKKSGTIMLEINGRQIDFKTIEAKAAKLGGNCYVVVNEKKIYNEDGKSVSLY